MINRILLWIDKLRFGEGRFYKPVTSPIHSGWTAFEILKGKYQGTIITFFEIRLEENSFRFYLPEGCKWSYTEIFPLAEKILKQVLIKMFSEPDQSPYQMGLKPGQEFEDDEDRDRYLEESHGERVIRKKGTAVPQGGVLPGTRRKTPV